MSHKPAVFGPRNGKDGLLLAVLTRGFTDRRTAITTPPQLPAQERLQGCARGYRRFAMTWPMTYTVMFAQQHPIELDDGVRTAALGAFDTLVDAIVAGQHANIVTDGNPHDIAAQVWACLHGAISLQPTASMIIQNPETNYENLIDTILHGISPETA